MAEVEDRLGRRFEKLRISLLNTCNFSCVYCVSEENGGMPAISGTMAPAGQQLNPDELIKLISAVHHLTPLKSIRLTGGEPLMYRYIYQLIEHIRRIGISDIRLTTNAFYLTGNAKRLSDAGVRSVNISVDAMDPHIFRQIARYPNTARVFKGIEAALKSGMQVKLNAVIMRGKNDSQIIPLLDYASELGVKIRFLELMKMGHLYDAENGLFFSQQEILDTVQETYDVEALPREYASTANYWRASNGGTFGIIANESAPFCRDCNRLRMDSRGFFYGCLSNSHGEKLAPYIHDESLLTDKLMGLLRLKQAFKFRGSELSMRNIGG
jgi:cyclic pyranopterin phosphate synthase